MITTNVYDKTKEKNVIFPASFPKGGVYTPVRELETNLLHCSGYGPDLGGNTVTGRLGRDLIVGEGRKATYSYALSLLANIEAKIGDLSKIRRFAKVLVSVNSANDFAQRFQIANSVSSLLVELFGEEIGCSVRSTVGTSALPGSIACEIGMLLEVEAWSVSHPVAEYNIFGTLSS